MKIRDGHALINGDKTTFTAPSGSIDIIADDNRALYDITLNEDGSIVIQVAGAAKHKEIIFDDRLTIIPVSSCTIRVLRTVYNIPLQKRK